jgi:hypothetical protein
LTCARRHNRASVLAEVARRISILRRNLYGVRFRAYDGNSSHCADLRNAAVRAGAALSRRVRRRRRTRQGDEREASSPQYLLPVSPAGRRGRSGSLRGAPSSPTVLYTSTAVWLARRFRRLPSPARAAGAVLGVGALAGYIWGAYSTLEEPENEPRAALYERVRDEARHTTRALLLDHDTVSPSNTTDGSPVAIGP